MKFKAGVIPYYRDPDGGMIMLFMVPSDANYGGAWPQIAKGFRDSGEDDQQAALREGAEELGLRAENIKKLHLIGSEVMPGKNSYMLSVFAVEVTDPANFDQPHYETGYTPWLTYQEFLSQGRPEHQWFVTTLINQIQSRD